MTPISQAPDQKKMDKLLALYQGLQEIPEEKASFEAKTQGLNLKSFYADPDNLRWIALRILQRSREAKEAVTDALRESRSGVLDLANKNLCDVTSKDLRVSLKGIWKVNLAGNFLRTVPPFCINAPFIERVNGEGNLGDIEEAFYTHRAQHQVSLDYLHLLKALAEGNEPGLEPVSAFYETMCVNEENSSLVKLAEKTAQFFVENPCGARTLRIHPFVVDDASLGGVRGFMSLSPFQDLKEIDLSGCSLERRPPLEWLSPALGLEVFKMNQTPVRVIPDSLRGKPLRVLEFSMTGITTVPDWIGEFALLKFLDLSDTRLDLLPDSLGQLKLDVCNLDGTEIKTVPIFMKAPRVYSIQRTPVARIRFNQLSLLRNNSLKVDEGNVLEVRQQKELVDKFTSDVLAEIVSQCDRFKTKEGTLPKSVKTHLVGMNYFIMIAALCVIKWLECGVVTLRHTCSYRDRRVKRANYGADLKALVKHALD